MPSHSEGPGIWLSVWRFRLTHCLYVLARLRGCAGSPEPSLLAYAISTKFAWCGPCSIKSFSVTLIGSFLMEMTWNKPLTSIKRVTLWFCCLFESVHRKMQAPRFLCRREWIVRDWMVHLVQFQCIYWYTCINYEPHHENTCLCHSEQQRRRSAYAVWSADVQADQCHCCSLPWQYNTSTCYSQNFKARARLCRRAGWWQTPEDRFSCDVAHRKTTFER